MKTDLSMTAEVNIIFIVEFIGVFTIVHMEMYFCYFLDFVKQNTIDAEFDAFLNKQLVLKL